MQVAEIDLRVGGTWRYVMTAQGGFEVAFHGEYREIVAERADRDHRGVRGDARRRRCSTSSRSARRTAARRSSCSSSAGASEIRDMILESGMEAGMQEQMDLLEELVTGSLE